MQSSLEHNLSKPESSEIEESPKKSTKKQTRLFLLLRRQLTSTQRTRIYTRSKLSQEESFQKRENQAQSEKFVNVGIRCAERFAYVVFTSLADVHVLLDFTTNQLLYKRTIF